MYLTPLLSTSAAPPASGPREDASLGHSKPAIREAAQAFEAAFIAEMLKHSGINANPEGFGGGAGEDAFASFLTSEYARLIAERGGFGLAEKIFEALAMEAEGR